MSSESRPEPVLIGRDSAGNPWLYAVPLTAADLCAPAGYWTILRAPDDPQSAGILRAVAFPTREIGYVWGMDGLLLRTDDGGHIWRFLRHDLPTAHAILSFPTPTIGYLGVRRVLLQTHDGRAVSHEASWALGTPQTLLRTDDGGRHWDLLTPLVDAPLPRYNRAFLPYNATYDELALAAQLRLGQGTEQVLQGLPGTLGYLRQVVFPSAEVGYALVLIDGHLPPSVGRALLRTDDSGHTWRIVLTRAQLGTMASYPWPLAFPLPETGFVLLREKLLHSADGGATWEERPYPLGVSVSDMIFPTATTGYLLGTTATSVDESHVRSPERRRILLRTQDGGHSWQQADRGGAAGPLACPNSATILAGGAAGTLWRSADSGRTWYEVEIGTPHWLLALACPDEETCYGVASDATIVKSRDGGRSWQVLTTGIDALYRMIGAPHLAR